MKRILDLFCGAGGAAMGYYRAGFEVVGVDNAFQKHYPFKFLQREAIGCLMGLVNDTDCAAGYSLEDFDVIHASPPCQAHTALKSMWNAKNHPDMIGDTRTWLIASGLPYVMENVPGAPLFNAFTLCGTMFDLGTGDAELRRHRLFECSFALFGIPECRHYARSRVCGVYGGHGRDRRRIRPATVGVYGNAGGKSVCDGTQQFSTTERKEAMGIDWMSGTELSQAIPPAYTEFIGKQLMRTLENQG